MQWKIEIERDGQIIYREEEHMADAYEKLIQAKDDTRGAAKVNLSYGESSEFARQKYSVSVTLTCDQNKQMLDRAFSLAIETMDDMVAKVEEKLGVGS